MGKNIDRQVQPAGVALEEKPVALTNLTHSNLQQGQPGTSACSNQLKESGQEQVPARALTRIH